VDSILQATPEATACLQRSANSFTAGSIAHSATGPGAGSVNVDGRLINYNGP